MGLLHGLRKRLAALQADRVDVGPTMEDVAELRRALVKESQRLGRTRGLSLTLFMEHTDMDLRRLDIFQVLAHLEAEGDLANLQHDSFGNVKFDVTEQLRGIER